MKKLVFSAAALTLTGTAVANDSDWAQLDQDIQALSASVQGLEAGNMTFGGRIRAIYANASDLDVGGFSVRNARIFSEGAVTDSVSYRVEVDFGSGPASGFSASGTDDNGDNVTVFGASPGGQIGLLDAYLDIQVGTQMTARVGQFRGHVLRESLIESGRLFFVERSVVASAFSGRQAGVALLGEFDQFNWGVTVQNGADGVTDELFFAVRGDINLMDKGTQLVEGAYGVNDQSEATIGASYFSDESVQDADGFAVDGSFATRQFSVRAALVSFGDGFSPAGADQEGSIFNQAIVGTSLADSTPFSIMGTFMLSEGTADYGAWEVGARFQDLDNADNTTIIDIGANYYVNGHDLKYIFSWTNVSSDTASAEFDLIQAGINARF